MERTELGPSMTTWTSLRGVLDSQSAAASWSPLEIHMTAVETDDQMYHLSEFGAAASQWDELGGRIQSAPAMAGFRPTRKEDGSYVRS